MYTIIIYAYICSVALCLDDRILSVFFYSALWINICLYIVLIEKNRVHMLIVEQQGCIIFIVQERLFRDNPKGMSLSIITTYLT